MIWRRQGFFDIHQNAKAPAQTPNATALIDPNITTEFF
jgi:hypothetical protein